jgi:nitrogen fixation/metabolism regulation signal transduction histidine kinase
METSTDRRKMISIALGGALLVIIATLTTLNNNLRFVNPSTTEEIFVFTGLSAVVFLVFVAVLVLLVRNVLKLYADQKSRVMGTRLRTRMLWGAVLVSLLPISFMSLFNFVLMNRAVDHWFSKPVSEMRDDSNLMALELSRYTTANARAEADSIAASLGSAPMPLAAGHRETEAARRVLEQHEITLQGGFALVYQEGRVVAAFHAPGETPGHSGETAKVKPWSERTPTPADDEDSPREGDGERAGQVEVAAGEVPAAIQQAQVPAQQGLAATILATAQRSDEPLFSLGKVDYALGTAGMKQGRLVVVGLPMPYGMAGTMSRLRADADSYWTLFRGRRQIRSVYMQLLLMMTCLALFASSWLALHLSKQVTRPVESLADAMDQISTGDYAHRVEESATEELGELVHSFNRMVADLESSRAQVEESTIQISRANAALEARRNELETMLETIPNGVAMLDADRRIVLTNRALTEMMDPGGQRPFLGVAMEEVFPGEVAEVLDRLIRRSHRMGSASSELETGGHASGNGTNGTGANGNGHNGHGGAGARSMNLLATVALLENVMASERVVRGYVVVIEDATELLQAQKQSAWKEVARRVAHEIKNPLTPISLSAEQIHRHVGRLGAKLADGGLESPSTEVIRRCSEVITASVESMRSLVDQFAALAEFPTAKPRPADLNTIVENSLALFAGRMQQIRRVTRLGKNLPLVMADPEALKRALGNLIDNAAEAMQTSLLREMRVTTRLIESGMVELTIADTGTGLTDEMRERLFLPYFSTKQRGTGLGLAIAAKIIQEHRGSIRAEKNEPAGARFIVELRPATVGDGDGSAAEGEQPLAVDTGELV